MNMLFRRGRPAIILIVVFFVFAGCSFDYEEGALAEDLSETVPETVLIEFVQVRTTSGKPDFRVYADRAEIYGKKKETVLEDVLYQDFDKSGAVVTEGFADRILYFTESEDAELEGNLRFYNADEEVKLEAEYLYWKDDEKFLNTRPDELVVLTKENGTVVTGRGFSAQGRSKTIDFAGGVGGTWVEDEEDEN